jgi:hypothetical protein
MSYIGLPPKATFSSGLLDRFTSTTGTTVTLTNDIASENDIVVFVNFVKQDSTTYSVGGTGNKTLTLGGTLVSSDIVEVHYLNIVGQTVNPSANSVGSSQLTADVITGQTELASGVASTDELLISDAGTLKRVDVSLIGGNNTPSFYATLTSDQTINDATATKVQLNNEILDTDNNFDNSSNYRFTPTTAGKYLIFGAVMLNAQSNTNMDAFEFYLQKNSTVVAQTTNTFLNNPIKEMQGTLSVVVDMDGSSDYIEMYAYIDTGSNGAGLVKGHSSPRARSYMGGMKIIT